MATYYASSCTFLSGRLRHPGAGLGRAGQKDRREPRSPGQPGETLRQGPGRSCRSFTIPTGCSSRSSAPARAVRENSRRFPGKRGLTLLTGQAQGAAAGAGHRPSGHADAAAVRLPGHAASAASCAPSARPITSPSNCWPPTGCGWPAAKPSARPPSPCTIWPRPAISSASAPISWRATSRRSSTATPSAACARGGTRSAGISPMSAAACP